MKITTFVQLLLQVAEIDSLEQESNMDCKKTKTKQKEKKKQF
jgi:hypothetical protein